MGEGQVGLLSATNVINSAFKNAVKLANVVGRGFAGVDGNSEDVTNRLELIGAEQEDCTAETDTGK